MTSSARSVTIANQHPKLRLERRALSSAIAQLDAHAAAFRGGCPAGELSLVFMTDATLAKLHADFLDDPAITDVITFEGRAELGSAGEICVSADAALRQAGRAKTAFSAELLLYVIHGWLHLAGFDDLQPAKKRVMRRAEARAMAMLKPGDRLPFRLIK